jgi:hypothetical protein
MKHASFKNPLLFFFIAGVAFALGGYLIFKALV